MTPLPTRSPADATAVRAESASPRELVTNSQLNKLVRRMSGASKANRDTAYEGLVYVRGTYERDRETLFQKMADMQRTIHRLECEVGDWQFRYDTRGKTIDAMEESIEEMHSELERLKLCETCEGEKVVEAFWEMPSVDGNYREVTCPRCKGTGNSSVVTTLTDCATAVRAVTTVITLHDERAPGWNKTTRLHWADRDKSNWAVWLAVRAALGDSAMTLLDYPVDVHVVATFKGRMLDSDNICSKFYIDAIKSRQLKDGTMEYRILREDDPKWVRRVTTESKHGKANSVVIVLTPVEGE